MTRITEFDINELIFEANIYINSFNEILEERINQKNYDIYPFDSSLIEDNLNFLSNHLHVIKLNEEVALQSNRPYLFSQTEYHNFLNLLKRRQKVWLYDREDASFFELKNLLETKIEKLKKLIFSLKRYQLFQDIREVSNILENSIIIINQLDNGPILNPQYQIANEAHLILFLSALLDLDEELNILKIFEEDNQWYLFKKKDADLIRNFNINHVEELKLVFSEASKRLELFSEYLNKSFEMDLLDSNFDTIISYFLEFNT